MAKKEYFKCSDCQTVHQKFQTKCSNCEARFTLEPTDEPSNTLLGGHADGDKKSSAGLKTSGAVAPTKKAQSLRDLKSQPIRRTPTGISELDRVLGGGFVDAEVLLFAGQPGAGKALAHSTDILTSRGFITMGDVREGDIVYDRHAEPTVVLQKHTPEITEAYRLTFTDGYSVDACGDHIWKLYDRGQSETLDTELHTEHVDTALHTGTLRELTTSALFSEGTDTASGEKRWELDRLHLSTADPLVPVKTSESATEDFTDASAGNDTEDFREHGREHDRAHSIQHSVQREHSEYRLPAEHTTEHSQSTDEHSPEHSAEHSRNQIVSIVEIPVEEQYSCLMVDSDDKTYLCTRGLIPTHNSTLSMSVADSFAASKKVLYSSGEESEQQIGLRAQRMGVDRDSIYVINETNLEKLLGHITDIRPDLLIVDSLQTLASQDVSGSLGSVTQSKEAAHVLTQVAKKEGITMILINQISKSGDFSGSESIQHIVDAAVMLESEKETPLKFLRATKNRFGDITEIGVFQHTEHGLEEVKDPSGAFTESSENTLLPGSACCIITEGVRSMPVEVQSLVNKTNTSFPRRQFNGVDYGRSQIVCAVVDRHTKVDISNDDAYLTTLSGVKVKDPQADLAIAAALLSSKKNCTVSEKKTAFIGELGLTGYIRGGYMMENKIREAEKIGFEQVVIPKNKVTDAQKKKFSLVITEMDHISELDRMIIPSAARR